MIIDDHLQWMTERGLATSTIRTRKRHLLALRRITGTGLLQVTPNDLVIWRHHISYLGAGAIQVAVSHVRCFYEWAADTGLLAGPSPARKIPVPRRAQLLPRPCDTRDLYRAIELAPQPLRLWLVLAAWCGLRCCEIAGLRVENIVTSGAYPGILIAADATKGRRERFLDLSQQPFVLAEIEAAGLPARGWAFGRRDGQPGPNRPSRVSQLIATYLHGLGIAATAHMMRHWFATGTLRACHDLRVVQELLGHKSIASTQIYAGWDRESGAAAIGALPAPGRHLQIIRTGEGTR